MDRRERRLAHAGDADECVGSITFIAALPAVKSAILLDGNGDGGQIKLDVDRKNVGALLLIQQQFGGRLMQITVSEVEESS